MAKPTQPILRPNFCGQHVVILGAGASRAAFPKGDKHGRALPLMTDLAEALGLGPVLEEHGFEAPNADFEALYSMLATTGQHQELVARIEKAVLDYFADLEVPDSPTLYDYMVLSLRPKDLIATFNWDPLLWQVLCRNARRLGPDVLPRVLHLHGNVAIGYCGKHMPGTIADRNTRCGKCGSLLAPSRLIYPVTQKNYNADEAIAASWRELQRRLKHAFILTVFGYRAPETDVEAIDLMKHARGDPNSEERVLDQMEIIDIRDEGELYRNWKPFISRGHFDCCRDFYQSLAAVHPRRSCEQFWEAIMECSYQEERPIPRSADWAEVDAWLAPLLEQERALVKEGRKG
jgi:hypothetical protein